MKAPFENESRLIVHIVFRFDYGGLENGVVNLINSLSGGPFRHVVIALTEATDFACRLSDDVPVYSLGKKPGKDLGAYVRLYKLLRQLRPTATHTRNIGTMDCAFVAYLARVPIRIHGEHGWDIFDPDGTSKKYRRMRQVLSHFVQQFVTVSADLRDWLIAVVRIPSRKVTHICNGVDTDLFRPCESQKSGAWPSRFRERDTVIVGSVTRFSAIKDPMNLVDAFIKLCKCKVSRSASVRLAMLGDGELRHAAVTRLDEAGLSDVAWLPGSRDDVAELLSHMDLFVLGSLREGVSNTILEAMASGLPVIACDTGGNRELVENGATGALVPTGDTDALASAIATYADDTRLRVKHGNASRERAETTFSIQTMIEKYRNLYATMLPMEGG